MHTVKQTNKQKKLDKIQTAKTNNANTIST